MSTYVSFVLDMSGSMEAVKVATIDATSEYAKSILDSGAESVFSVTMFNSAESVTGTWTSTKDVDKVKTAYKPFGMTPLYDAIGIAVTEAEQCVEGDKDITKVLIAILTDGLENASREYDTDSISELIERKQNDGWTFVFLGATQEAIANARRINLPKGNTQMFSPQNTGKTVASLAAGTRSYLFSASGQSASSGDMESETDWFETYTGHVDDEPNEAE